MQQNHVTILNLLWNLQKKKKKNLSPTFPDHMDSNKMTRFPNKMWLHFFPHTINKSLAIAPFEWSWKY